jgi:hypothetical protein
VNCSILGRTNNIVRITKLFMADPLKFEKRGQSSLRRLKRRAHLSMASDASGAEWASHSEESEKPAA